MEHMNDWENRLNLIWSRAHIPEFANDARGAIRGLISELLSAERLSERKAVVEEIKADSGAIFTNLMNKDGKLYAEIEIIDGSKTAFLITEEKLDTITHLPKET